MLLNLGNPLNRSHPLNRGLVGYWLPMQNNSGGQTLFDLAGGNHGALTNGPLWVPNTRAGALPDSRCLSFDGTNDYVSIADNDNLENHIMTFSAWIKASAWGNSVVAMKRIGATEYGQYSVATNIGNIYWLQSSGAGAWHTNVNTSQPSAGTWHHVAATNDGTYARLYIDGIEVGTADATPATSLAASTEPLNIGFGRVASANSYFNGLIDDVHIYNRALSASEVWQLYEESQLGYSNILNWYEDVVFGWLLVEKEIATLWESMLSIDSEYNMLYEFLKTIDVSNILRFESLVAFLDTMSILWESQPPILKQRFVDVVRKFVLEKSTSPDFAVNQQSVASFANNASVESDF